MAYTLTAITSASDCDVLIDQLNDTRKGLLNKQQNLEYKSDTTLDDALDFQDQLQQIEMDLVYAQQRLDGMAEGERKEQQRTLVMDKQVQIRKMNERKSTYGAIGATMREYAVNCAERQLEETDQLIADANARKTALSA